MTFRKSALQAKSTNAWWQTAAERPEIGSLRRRFVVCASGTALPQYPGAIYLQAGVFLNGTLSADNRRGPQDS